MTGGDYLHWFPQHLFDTSARTNDVCLDRSNIGNRNHYSALPANFISSDQFTFCGLFLLVDMGILYIWVKSNKMNLIHL